MKFAIIYVSILVTGDLSVTNFLADTQRFDYAKSDPTFDITRNDTVHSLVLLTKFGI